MKRVAQHGRAAFQKRNARFVGGLSVNAASKREDLYFQTVDDLAYLHSPNALMERSGLCVQIVHELYALAKKSNDAVDVLNIIDTMNNSLCLLLDPAEATRSTHPSEVYRNNATEAFTYAFQHMSELNSSRDLYDALMVCKEGDHWERLTPIQRRNFGIMKDDMDSNGIHFPKEKRDVVVRLTEAKEKYAHDLVTCPPQHRQEVLDVLIQTRHDLAAFLGNESFAHWTLHPTMAKTPSGTWALVNAMSAALQQKAEQEAKLLHAVKGHRMRSETPPPVEDSEVAFLMQEYREHVYGASLHKLSEYLSVANVWRGLQMICKKIFNVSVVLEKEMESYEKYHPTVQKYVLYEGTEGASGKKIGTIYADLLQRPDKMPCAGHYTVQLGTQQHLKAMELLDAAPVKDGKQLPIVIFSCNASASAGSGGTHTDDFWENVLLSVDETQTLFHEFGHALHTVFGQTEYQNLAGTRASLDYVECFSQLMEYFVKDYRVLREFAFHHKTQEPVPEDLVVAVNESSDAFFALGMMQQLLTSAADLVYHGPRPLQYLDLNGVPQHCNAVSDVLPALNAIHNPIKKSSTNFAMSYSFQHMSNYPAAYYSYMYSKVLLFVTAHATHPAHPPPRTTTQVLAAAIWEKHFLDNPFCADGGMKLRHVMGLGASEDPSVMLAHVFDDGVTDPCILLKNLKNLGHLG